MALPARYQPRSLARSLGSAVIGAATVGLLRITRYFDRFKTSDFFARVVRLIGPHLREHQIGRANLAAAFPEKSPEEIEEILMGVWDNLGRVAAEFAHIDRVWDLDREHPERGRIEVSARSLEIFDNMRFDGKPALIFGAHFANWELPALAGIAHGLDTAMLYRKPNIASADRIIQEIRQVKMGKLIAAGRNAPPQLADALKAGLHVGMLVDQYLSAGVEVTFFGRKTRANPMLARLVRLVECPIHGVHVVRLPDHRFRAEVTEEIAPVRDETGKIDIEGTTQRITSVVEGWIREHPEQWLWLHRRWR